MNPRRRRYASRFTPWVLAGIFCLGTGPAGAGAPNVHGARIWEFNDGDLESGWVLEGAAKQRPEAVAVANGHVRITARAKTWDRVKITTTDRQFGPGTYTWRVHVPAMGKGDMASIGAFIYRDDKHEMDFEIGPGTAEVRRKLNAADDELICYCTNQAFPYGTTQVKIKGNAWYTLTLGLIRQHDATYLARWAINGRRVAELKTTIPADTRFGIHASVENLKFLGDHQPLRDHQALFDRITFTPPAAP